MLKRNVKLKKDLENGKSNKDISEKYGVPRCTTPTLLKREKFCLFCGSHAQTQNEKQCIPVSKGKLTKLYLIGFLLKGVQIDP